MERMLVSGADYFTAKGVSSLIVGQGDQHPYADELRAAGYRVAVIPPVRSLSGARQFRRLVAAERPDVVHIHAESAYALSTLAAVFGRHAPAVVRTVHNVFTPTGRARQSRRVQSAIGDHIAGVVVVPSPDVAANELAAGRTTTLIYNWVSDPITAAGLRRTEQSEQSDHAAAVPAALIVGNCSAIKNHEGVLELLFDGGFDLYHHGDEHKASADSIRAGRPAALPRHRRPGRQPHPCIRLRDALDPGGHARLPGRGAGRGPARVG
jgi:hypothetical protein